MGKSGESEMNTTEKEHVVDLNKSSLNVEAAKEEAGNRSEWETTLRGRRVRKGGWRTMPFIFGNEMCEKLGAIGLQVNLVTYLQQQLHFKSAEAANTLTNFGGTAALTPLVGAIIADAYVGRYWVVLVGSILYTLGCFVLTLQAMFPNLKPPQCSSKSFLCEHASSGHVGILYLAFFFLATGSGGIRPCVAAFGADQFNEEDPKQRIQIRHFFNWYYFTIQVSVLITVTVFVYIQDNIGWVLGFGIPTILMALSIIFFIIGTPLYREARPAGSPLSRLFHVVTSATRKHKLKLPEDPDELFGAKDKLDSATRLMHTEQFRFLDKAAIVTEDDRRRMREGNNVDPWKLCSVHKVEELKLLLRMLPIWATSILVFAAWSQQGTFWVQQGRTMDRHIFPNSNFEIPPGSMTAFTTIALLVAVPIYDKLAIPFLRKFTGHERGISFLQRIGIGLVVSVFVMVSAAIVEVKRRNVAERAGLLDHPTETVPISIFWLLPQYVLVGIMELFLSIGQMEFFYDQSPESMRSMSTAVFWLIIGSGSYLSTFLVTIIHKYSGGNGRKDWLASNLNRGRLDHFYWFFALALSINFCIYLVCAKWYQYKKWNDSHIKVVVEESDQTNTR